MNCPKKCKEYSQENYKVGDIIDITIHLEVNTKLNTENTKDIEIVIFNLKGQKIKQYSIISSQSSIIWDGTNDNNQPVSSGIYYYQLQVGNEIIVTEKCLLLK